MEGKIRNLDDFLNSPYNVFARLSEDNAYPVEYFFYLFNKLGRTRVFLIDVINYNIIASEPWGEGNIDLLGRDFSEQIIIPMEPNYEKYFDRDKWLLGRNNGWGGRIVGDDFQFVKNRPTPHPTLLDRWRKIYYYDKVNWDTFDIEGDYNKATWLWNDFSTYYYLDKGEIKHRKSSPLTIDNIMNDIRMNYNNEPRDLKLSSGYSDGTLRKIRGLMENLHPNFNREYEINMDGNVVPRGCMDKTLNKYVRGLPNNWSPYGSPEHSESKHAWEHILDREVRYVSDVKHKNEHNRRQRMKSDEKLRRRRPITNIFSGKSTSYIDEWLKTAYEDAHKYLDTEKYEDDDEPDPDSPSPEIPSDSSLNTPPKTYAQKLEKYNLIIRPPYQKYTKIIKDLLKYIQNKKVDISKRRQHFNKFRLKYHPDKIISLNLKEEELDIISKMYLMVSEVFAYQTQLVSLAGRTRYKSKRSKRRKHRKHRKHTTSGKRKKNRKTYKKSHTKRK